MEAPQHGPEAEPRLGLRAFPPEVRDNSWKWDWRK